MTNRALVFVWGPIAVANVAIGVWRALAPGRSHDLKLMHTWTQLWLFGHTNLYRVYRLDVDYPPNAIVLLSPLALVALIGVSLGKPHVGAPLLLWALLTKRVGMLAGMLGSVGALFVYPYVAVGCAVCRRPATYSARDPLLVLR